jgi:hypothetical protein
MRSWTSSVSIVYDHRLDNWTTRVQSQAEAMEFSCSLRVQTSSDAHPSLYPVGTKGPIPGSKVWLGSDADHSHQFRAKFKNE